jgi:hypothetical protein
VEDSSDEAAIAEDEEYAGPVIIELGGQLPLPWG